VKLGGNGHISLLNGSWAPVQLIADVAGYYLDGTPSQPGTFVPLPPTRLLDTRAISNALSAGERRRVAAANTGGVPANVAGAMVLNQTVTQPNGSGYLTVFPAGIDAPTASNLNFVAGQTVANLAIVKAGPLGDIVALNGSGSWMYLIIDVS